MNITNVNNITENYNGRYSPAIEVKIDSPGRHQKYINLASKLAKSSSFPKYRMCAVVVKSGRVLTFSVNKVSPGILKDRTYHEKNCHAELLAVLQLNPAVLRGATVYVSGFTKGNNHCKSKPCVSCEDMLRSKGIKCAIWHDPVGDIFRTSF